MTPAHAHRQINRTHAHGIFLDMTVVRHISYSENLVWKINNLVMSEYISVVLS